MRPYYVHTASGYAQYEYPTTMTAIELGLNISNYGMGLGGGMSSGRYSPGFGSNFRGSLPVQTPYSASAIARQEWPPTSRTYPNSQFNSSQYYGGSEGMGIGYGSGRMYSGSTGYGNQMTRYGSGYGVY
jgi:hypothetical protein